MRNKGYDTELKQGRDGVWYRWLGPDEMRFIVRDIHQQLPEMDSRSRATVSRLQQDELRYQLRLGWSLVAWFVGGMVVGLGAWFLHKPMDRDETAFGAVLGLGLATFFFGGLFSRMLIRKPETKCPQCGTDWKLSEEDSNNLLTWKCCPGCGLTMSDDTCFGTRSSSETTD